MALPTHLKEEKGAAEADVLTGDTRSGLGRKLGPLQTMRIMAAPSMRRKRRQAEAEVGTRSRCGLNLCRWFGQHAWHRHSTDPLRDPARSTAIGFLAVRVVRRCPHRRRMVGHEQSAATI